MEKFLNQFRRLYDDRGINDKDFTKEEQKLKEAQYRLVDATNELARSSEKLNAVAMNAYTMDRHNH